MMQEGKIVLEPEHTGTAGAGVSGTELKDTATGAEHGRCGAGCDQLLLALKTLELNPPQTVVQAPEAGLKKEPETKEELYDRLLQRKGDTVFSRLFLDPGRPDRRYLLHLALCPMDTETRADQIKDVSWLLDAGKSDDTYRPYNSLAFLIQGKVLDVVEATSIPPAKAPLRMFLNCGRFWYGLMSEEVPADEWGAEKLPQPRCFVLYTGTENFPSELHLSGCFRQNAPVPAESGAGDKSQDRKSDPESSDTIRILTHGPEEEDIVSQYIRYCKTVDRLLAENRQAEVPLPVAAIIPAAMREYAQECMEKCPQHTHPFVEFLLENLSDLEKMVCAETAVWQFEVRELSGNGQGTP